MFCIPSYPGENLGKVLRVLKQVCTLNFNKSGYLDGTFAMDCYCDNRLNFSQWYKTLVVQLLKTQNFQDSFAHTL